MRRYTFLSALWRAVIFDRALYQDAALHWRGIAMPHLLSVLALTWLVALITWTVQFNHYLNTDAKKDLADFPTMTITSGHLSSPVKQPFVYHFQGQPIFVLDTTGQVKRPSDKGVQTLITDTQIIQEPPGPTRSLATAPDSVVDQDWVMGWLRVFRNCIIPVGFVLLGGFSVLWRLGAALLYAAIGLAFAASLKARIPYAAIMRLAMLAMTPVLLVDTLLCILKMWMACWTFLVFPLISLVYLFYGVKVTAQLLKETPAAFKVEPTASPIEAPATQAPPSAPRRDPFVSPETDQLFP